MADERSVDGSPVLPTPNGAAGPLAFVILGIATYVLSPLFGAWSFLDIDLAPYGGVSNVAIAVTLGAAMFARRTAWRASFASATLAATVTLFLLPRAFTAVSVSGRPVMIPSRWATSFNQAQAGRLAIRKAELIQLERGRDAALAERPLLAQEGGYLSPTKSDDLRHFDSAWRLTSVPSPDTSRAWTAAVREQSDAIREFEGGAGARPSLRNVVGLRSIPFLVFPAFALALVANLLGLASHRLFGASK